MTYQHPSHQDGAESAISCKDGISSQSGVAGGTALESFGSRCADHFVDGRLLSSPEALELGFPAGEFLEVRPEGLQAIGTKRGQPSRTNRKSNGIAGRR
jgi:hypothetical protein